MCERTRVGCAFLLSSLSGSLGYFMHNSAGDDRIWNFVSGKGKRGVGPVCEDIYLGWKDSKVNKLMVRWPSGK